MALASSDGPVTNGLEQVYLINDSLPELDWADIDLSTDFVRKKLALPVLINAMTGGTPEAITINDSLAETAGRFGLGMAVGSQSIAIHEPEWRHSFALVREKNPDGVILANINAGADVNSALQAIKMIAADAIQLHFNIPQELAMAEGDRSFSGIGDQIKKILDQVAVPVIAKEVGFGFSRDSVNKLMSLGITKFDVGGQGGTNFIAIEDKESGLFDHELDSWGIPTAVSLAEIMTLDLPIQIIAGGGVRNALDTAKALALGADLVGIAQPFLQYALHPDGKLALTTFVEKFSYQLKAIFLMSGAANIKEMQEKPVIITGEIAQRLTARGVDLTRWGDR